MSTLNKPILVMAAALAGSMGLTGVAVGAASDNFDSYADGTNLVGTGNGQISYSTPGPIGSPIGGTSVWQASASGLAQSAPNVGMFADNADNFGSVRARLAPASAIDLSAVGATANLEFDFYVASSWQGPGSRASMTVGMLYAVDANGAAEDYIDRDHHSGISDNGLWWLNNGNDLPNPDVRYQALKWYHYDLQVARPTGANGVYDYRLEITEIGGGSLGVITHTGSTANTRNWLTGFHLNPSSNPTETILFDNVRVTPEPASALLLLSGAGLLMRRRRRA